MKDINNFKYVNMQILASPFDNQIPIWSVVITAPLYMRHLLIIPYIMKGCLHMEGNLTWKKSFFSL